MPSLERLSEFKEEPEFNIYKGKESSYTKSEERSITMSCCHIYFDKTQRKRICNSCGEKIEKGSVCLVVTNDRRGSNICKDCVNNLPKEYEHAELMYDTCDDDTMKGEKNEGSTT